MPNLNYLFQQELTVYSKVNNHRAISAGDVLIHCQVVGESEATPLLFLHGNGEDLHIFDPQIAYFSKSYKVVAIDTRGHGESTRGTEPLTFDTFAADLITLLDALHIKQAHLVGFSDGAVTALHTAIKHPKRILSMVLLGANYTPRGFKWFPYISVRLVYAWLCVVSLFAKSKRLQREIWGLMVYQPHLTLDEIGGIRVPTLVVTGEKDMVSQRQNNKMCRAIEGAQRLVIEGGDHFWILKQPDVLNNVIMHFLIKG